MMLLTIIIKHSHSKVLQFEKRHVQHKQFKEPHEIHIIVEC